MERERFHGTFEYSLDGKSRLILPARLRGPFDNKKAVVSCYVDQCLAVWTQVEYDRHLATAKAMELRGQAGRNLARTLSSMSAELDMDAQWRLTIPFNLREYARLEADSPVTVIGAIDRIELWHPELLRQNLAPSLTSLADGTSLLFPQQDQAALAVAAAAPGPSTHDEASR